MVRRGCVSVAFLVLFSALPVAAQTNDAYWSLWNAREERLSARAQALAGVAVVLNDDSAAAAANPALLATLTRSELVGGFTTFGRANFGTIGGGGLLKSGIALGGFVRRPATFSETATDRRLDYELTEGGVTVAAKRGHLAGGLTMRVSRLALTAESLSQESGGPLRVGAGAGSTRLGVTAGLVWNAGPWTIGSSYQTGSTFSATRTSVLDGLTDDAGSEIDVARPWLLSLGASHQGVRLGVYGQVDLRQSGVARRENRGPSAGVYDGEKGGLAAMRAGVQYAFPFGGISVIARAGVARLASAGIRYVGPNSAETQLFEGSKAATRPTFGVGVVLKNGVSLDAAASDEGTVALEGRIRF